VKEREVVRGGGIRTEGERGTGDGAGGAVEEGNAGVVDTPLAVAAPAGAGRGGVGGRRVGRAEADGDGDLLHGAAAVASFAGGGRRGLGGGFQISV
jgi:hypothetical protein